MLTLNHYLVLSAVLFSIGTAGVFLRRNLITLLLSVEIMLNAVNLTFVAVGRYLGSVDGMLATDTIQVAECHLGFWMFGAPIRVAAGGERRALAAWVAVLEAAVCRHPEQWFNFYDVWHGPPAR